MGNAVRKRLLIVNYLALAAFTGCWAYAAVMAPLSTRGRVTELDRAEVINEEKLKERWPEFTGLNLRSRLGPWIAAVPLDAAKGEAIAGMLVALFNIVGLHLAGPRKAPVPPISVE